MSKRAEEAALSLYPFKGCMDLDEYATQDIDLNEGKRNACILGYEQAEKDLALAWEDIAKIITIYEQCVESDILMKYTKERDVRGASEEVLRRFNEQKMKL